MIEGSGKSALTIIATVAVLLTLKSIAGDLISYIAAFCGCVICVALMISDKDGKQ